MPFGVLSLPGYAAGLSTGDPTDVVFGTGDSGPTGVDAVIEFNGLYLNQRQNLETYVITDIDGLHDADIRDSRESNPQDDGEVAFDSYYGGRTITMSGYIRSRTLNKLRDMQQGLRTAFADLKQEKALVFHAAEDQKSLFIYGKKHQSLAMGESQQNFRFERSFQIAVRCSNPRFLSLLPESATLVAGNTVVIQQYGSYNSQPVITLQNVMSQPVISNTTTGRALMLSGSIANGNFVQIDIAKRRVVDQSGANRFDLIHQDSDWPVLEPGPNTIQFSAISPGVGNLCTIVYRHSFI